MKKKLRDMRPVYVVGIGLHRYQRLSETPYVTLGLTAVREKDALVLAVVGTVMTVFQ